MQLSEEERRGFSPVVVIFRGRGRGVRPIVVSLQGLVAEGSGSSAMVGPGGGRAAALVGRRRGLVIPGEVGTASGRAAVHLGEAAPSAGPVLAAPVLPARRPLFLPGVLPEIQLGWSLTVSSCDAGTGVCGRASTDGAAASTAARRTRQSARSELSAAPNRLPRKLFI